MPKSVKICLAIAIVLFCGAVAAMLLLSRPSESSMVEIVQDGAVIARIDLTRTQDREIRIPSADGGYNLVTIRDHGICISKADCPDQTCVKMGVLRAEGLPIVCLPHKLVIRFADGE